MGADNTLHATGRVRFLGVAGYQNYGDPCKEESMLAIETLRSAKRLEWQLVEIRDVVTETPRVKSLHLHVTGWPGHPPGQHIDIRLTADDGYQAQRSYSIASPPEDGLLDLTIERLNDREVSRISLTNFVLAINFNCGDLLGHDARAEALLQPEHRPSQHKPAHVEIRQQW